MVNVKNFIINFPQQLEKGILSAKDVKIDCRFENVLVCGMGGSAWPAEILRDWLNPNFCLWVNKNYVLPNQTNKKTLVIICSYSGNTEEALSCYDEAKKRGLAIVGLTTGGKLKELCQQDGVPLVLIPDDVPAPRLGCGYTIGATAKILNKAGLIENKDDEIVSAAKKINVSLLEKEAQDLVAKIGDRIPIIYTTDNLKTLSFIWKIKFNETSKIPAFAFYFPELNHNELGSYTQKKDNNFIVIILKDNNDLPRILKRMALTAEMIQNSGTKVEFVDLTGQTVLEKILNSIVLADWTTYYLAEKNGIDPFDLKLQNEIKEKLNKK